MKVLIIDDDPSDQRVLSALVLSCGHQPTTVPSADAARTALATSAWDAIFLDVMLGDDGQSAGTLAAQMLDDGLRDRLVIITGFSPDEAGARLPAADYSILVKPLLRLDVESVLDAIDALHQE